MLYIWTDDLILSYVEIFSYAKDLIPDICGQHLNNSELYKYSSSKYSFFSKHFMIT